MDRDAVDRVARRLVAHWTADAWTGLCVRIVPAATRETADERITTPDHFLAAAWAPASQGPARWPEAVVIGSPDATRALDQLLCQLPAKAKLYLADCDQVDAALAAEVLLEGDRNLEGYQRDAIVAFRDAERARVRDAIIARYIDRDPGFERFRTRVLGDGPR